MKSIRIIYITLVFLILFNLHKAFSNDEIMNAFRDEIKRSMNELKLESLQKPYYIEYSIKIETPYTIQATLGSLTESSNIKRASLNVTVKVGDYKFDNTNFFDFGLSFFGSGDDEERFKNRNIPLELNYNNLRRELWLATDAAYKQAAEIFSKKESSVKNKIRKDTIWDFELTPPEINNAYTPIPEINFEKYKEICKQISSIFLNYKKINTSSVTFEYLPKIIYYANSEGREYVKTELHTGLEVIAATQSSDGMPITNFYTVYSLIPKDLPTLDSITTAVKSIAAKLEKTLDGDVLEESYSGPVIFEGQAAAEVFAQVFAPNLATQRAPMTETGFQESDRFTSFQTKIGGRVLPEFLSVKAIPDKTEYNKVPLIGTFKIDDDGILAKRVDLVMNGYLKNLLSSRTPIRRVSSSNGHKRGGAPMYSILELFTDAKYQKSDAELKSKMLKLCKDRALPFGIIVRKALNQNILYTTLFRVTSGTFPYPSSNSTPLVEVYKVFPDGKEVLLRGVEANRINVQSFKDIISTGKNKYVLNLLAPSITSPFISGGSHYISSTIISPSFLFEDVEIKPIEGDFPKPPIIKNPLTENN